ncbi:MAG: hypothetical protein ACP5QZ_05430 [Candidatus Sumerlaeaceae bacterium]
MSQRLSLRTAAWLRELKENPVFLTWLAAVVGSLALGCFFPALPWVLIPVAVIGHGIQILAEARKSVRMRLGAACAVSLVITVASAWIAGFHNPETCPLSLDDATYLVQGKAIAEAWKSGLFPSLSSKGSTPYYIGSLHTGYQRLLAGAFYLLRADYRFGILLNFIAASLLPLFVYSAVLTLLKTHSPSELASKGALRGTWLVALYPSIGYWASWLLKDVVLALIFAAAIAGALDFAYRHRPEHLLYLAASLVALGVFRAYSALAVLAGTAVYLLAKLPHRQSLQGLAILGFLLLLASYDERWAAFERQLLYSLGELLPDSVRTPREGLLYVLGGFPRLLLSPYAWVRARVENPMYELYPGMWWLYLVGYPLAVIGITRLARHNIVLAVIPLIAWFASAIILILAYGGAAPRQRLYLDVLVFVFAGCGTVERPHKWLLVAWYLGLGVYVTIHLLTLDMRGV